MYQGFFINLDRSEDRRQALIRHLVAIGADARYQRFPAIDGRTCDLAERGRLSFGEIGCWLSHLGVLTTNRESTTHLHVIEDDIVFAQGAVNVFDSLLEQVDSLSNEWDLIFLDIVVPLDLKFHGRLHQKLKEYRQTGALGLLNLASVEFASMSSYFVNRRSIGKLADLLAGQWTRQMPVDLYLRTLVNQRQVNAYVVAPFLTSLSQQNQYSEIRDAHDDKSLSRQITYLHRRGFFKDANLESLANEMQELVKDVKVEPLERILISVLTLNVSDKFRTF